MENKIIKVEYVSTQVKTFVYLTLETAIACILPNTWEEGVSTQLRLSLSQLLHLLADQIESDIDIDINVMLDVQRNSIAFKDVLADVLTGSTISLVQRKREVGSIYTDATGAEVVAAHNSIGVESLAVTDVTALGRFALNAEPANETYRGLPERRAVLKATLKAKAAAALAAAKAEAEAAAKAEAK